MVCTAWRTGIPGFLLLVATCSEGSAAYVGDRFFPSTLATTVPTAADFYNPPYFVKLPDTAVTPSTREFDIPTTYSRLITKDWSVFFTETFRVIEDATDIRDMLPGSFGDVEIWETLRIGRWHLESHL